METLGLQEKICPFLKYIEEDKIGGLSQNKSY